MPSAIVRIDGSVTGAPAASDTGYAAAPARLHPDDRDVRAQRLHRGGDAAEQAAAADADQHRAHVRHLLEDLQPDGALPGDDVDVVEGVHEHRAGLGRELAARRRGSRRRCGRRSRTSAP